MPLPLEAHGVHVRAPAIAGAVYSTQQHAALVPDPRVQVAKHRLILSSARAQLRENGRESATRGMPLHGPLGCHRLRALLCPLVWRCALERRALAQQHACAESIGED